MFLDVCPVKVTSPATRGFQSIKIRSNLIDQDNVLSNGEFAENYGH